jgi:hypothetical protein
MSSQVFLLPIRADHEHSTGLAAMPSFFVTPLVIEPSPGKLSGDAGPANGSEGRQLCRITVTLPFAQKERLQVSFNCLGSSW